MSANENAERAAPIRVLVTGTRGKSSLVRLLHAGFTALGRRTYSRVTGVLPRSLTPDGERVIHRDAPANFREMRWWLGTVPADADAVVMENSAVSPELQPAAAAWLKPAVVVWTTLRADHEDQWGRGAAGAADALLRGVPPGVRVIAGEDAERVRTILESRGCNVGIVRYPPGAPEDFRAFNLSLAAAALRAAVGADEDISAAVAAMKTLPPDIADFRITGGGDDLLAAAFSANEPESTELLFRSTGWTAGETTLLYHHRPDRPERLRGFAEWIVTAEWRDVFFTGDRRSVPFGRLRRLNWVDEVTDAESFARWRRGRGRIFACGNVAGWPLEMLKAMRNAECGMRN